MRRILASLLFCTPLLFAQAAPQAAQPPKKVVSIDPAARAAQLAIKSPEVHPDGTITFRYTSPTAEDVKVYIEGNPDPFQLTKDDKGIWTYTTPPMPPEYYGYFFLVDGQRNADPRSTLVRPNLLQPSNVAYVRGNPPRPWDRTDIPHGEVHHHLYVSKLANDDRDLWVYTPPNYDPKRKEKYPVLYLLHGYSDGAEGWLTAGQANLIMDTLLAEGKIKPMVVVMPLAYGTMDMIKNNWGVWQSQLPFKNQELFADQLIHEVLPYAEARYNIASDSAHRAIAGLSMGGGHTLYTGLNNPDVFGYVGAMSSAVFTDKIPTLYPGRTKAKLKLLFVSCGTEDGLITANRAFETWAKTNVQADRFELGETPGMHTWLVWRENLIKLAPMLFNNPK